LNKIPGSRGDERFAELIEFIAELVFELNHHRAGEVVLVEGKRDALAIRELGYSGPLVSISSLKKADSKRVLASRRRVVILTDLDREGGSLAGRYSRILKHDGHDVSLEERRRLLKASRGVFRHIENLRRFSNPLPIDDRTPDRI
jgi:5S rRNA maturation endonuclease (ribonuclease M5)